ncbi:unnamed protein product [Miscanthus lutarioriparius]|uniref:Uncharacterized protein n=1 Tax=Miscanthus lutarioriparius TaxID=422564 RepID=A0A811R4L8_9POAL|nr:unnamed protein product [Miscanthus lutarioriparius]
MAAWLAAGKDAPPNRNNEPPTAAFGADTRRGAEIIRRRDGESKDLRTQEWGKMSQAVGVRGRPRVLYLIFDRLEIRIEEIKDSHEYVCVLRALACAVLPVSLETMDALLAPFFPVLEKSTDRVVVTGERQSVACLEMVRKGEEVEKGSAEEKLGKVGLLFGFSKRFLDIGAKGKGRDGAIERKVVFGLRDAFVKIEKGLQRSGLEIPVPKSEATEEKAQKKKKKAKKAALAEGEMEEAKVLKPEKKVKQNKKKKEKKKKKRKVEVVDQGNATEKSTMGDGIDGITFDEALKSNLQKQFEMAAAEAGMAKGGSSSSASPVTAVSEKVATKRKRSRSADKLSEASDGDDGSEVFEAATFGSSKRKRTEKGRLARAHSPIAPTPLKKAKPKAKSAKVLKKQPSSAVKRLRKLQCFSA